jgi:ATP-binding cassette subfamily B protein
MEAGRVVERGTHQQLIAADGLYAQMWKLQQREAELPAASEPRRDDREAA